MPVASDVAGAHARVHRAAAPPTRTARERETSAPNRSARSIIAIIERAPTISAMTKRALFPMPRRWLRDQDKRRWAEFLAKCASLNVAGYRLRRELLSLARLISAISVPATRVMKNRDSGGIVSHELCSAEHGDTG